MTGFIRYYPLHSTEMDRRHAPAVLTPDTIAILQRAGRAPVTSQTRLRKQKYPTYVEKWNPEISGRQRCSLVTILTKLPRSWIYKGQNEMRSTNLKNEIKKFVPPMHYILMSVHYNCIVVQRH
jgi:hypothetical protein